MSEGELLALALAQRVLRQYRGTPYAPDLARAFKKITEGLTDRVTVDLGELADSFSFRTTAPDGFDPGVFRDLAAAVRDRRKVVLRYWTASRDEETLREVDPFHLACVDGHWYLVGFCHSRGEARMFAPSRVRSLEVTGTTFDVPEGFRIDEYLSRSFGVLRGGDGEASCVRLRFTGDAARYVRERAWHPSQTLETCPDGDVIVGLEVSHLREVERWALSWGGDCEVLGPPELRSRVAAESTRLALCHSHAGDEGDRIPEGMTRTVRPGSRRKKQVDRAGVRRNERGRDGCSRGADRG
jgi:predicted DNA-binding transcriptional regulator YafY